MAAGWIEDKKRVDKFEPLIKQILGLHLILTADIQRDEREATDLMVLELRPFRVGCRIRSFDYLNRYPDEFTIRSDRPSGFPSELTKIVDGWGDYLFYGFADAAGLSLASWFIGDLHIFRGTFSRNLFLRQPQFLQRNGDESSRFFAWPLNQFPAAFVIARKIYKETNGEANNSTKT